MENESTVFKLQPMMMILQHHESSIFVAFLIDKIIWEHYSTIYDLNKEHAACWCYCEQSIILNPFTVKTINS
jgi:hypothetical protein